LLKIIFLGTGSFMPTKLRGAPAILIKSPKSTILLDCGEGTQNRIINIGIGIQKIDLIAITHMHGDHVFGLLPLLHTLSNISQTPKLRIMGPKTLKDFIEENIKLTLIKNIDIEFTRPSNELCLSDLRIKGFEVDHGMESYGYIIEFAKAEKKLKVNELIKAGIPRRYWPQIKRGKKVTIDGKTFDPSDFVEIRNRKIVYSGDTKPIANTIRAAYNAKVLIHEATFTSRLKNEAEISNHSTALDAAKIALEANAEVLILTHISARYPDPYEHLYESRRVFRNTFVAEDYDYYIVM